MAAKKETKSEFLRKALKKNPNLSYQALNRRWTTTGHTGEISNALYYQVRAKLGIKTVWTWVRESEPEVKTGSARTPREVYQFKITLLESRPPIWRRIQVEDCTLDKLHEHIQTAMGWANSHMNHFRIRKDLFGDPMLMGENFGEFRYKDSTTIRLSSLLHGVATPFRFEYEYDFGDSWAHEVCFEGRVPATARVRYPVCLEGARACPPEDCGGVWGYVDFLEAISDPANAEHEEMLEWIGGKFDPAKFSPSAATRRMKEGLPDWRSMR